MVKYVSLKYGKQTENNGVLDPFPNGFQKMSRIFKTKFIDDKKKLMDDDLERLDIN